MSNLLTKISEELEHDERFIVIPDCVDIENVHFTEVRVEKIVDDPPVKYAIGKHIYKEVSDDIVFREVKLLLKDVRHQVKMDEDYET